MTAGADAAGAAVKFPKAEGPGDRGEFRHRQGNQRSPSGARGDVVVDYVFGCEDADAVVQEFESFGVRAYAH